MAHPSTTDYRPDIDGLRAVAVLLVVAFHAFPAWVPGGFIGVDVFFVISGYLITGICVRELSREGFSYLGFYARRFRRIIPALFVVVASTWLAGRGLLLADDFEQLGKHLVGAATFTSNFLLVRESGYFDSAAELKPFLHLWSLAVEEQFYLIWPLLLVFTFRRKHQAIWVSLLALASFGINLARVVEHRAEAYYLLPSRFWELLAGAVLALIVARRQRPLFPSQRVSAMIGVAALAALVACAARGRTSALLLDSRSVYPGFWALVPTGAAFLLIAVGPQAFVNRRLLSLRPAVWVGLISYPLYLWHWPLLALGRLLLGSPTAPWIRAVTVLASIALAWLTWRFVERPIRAHAFASLAPRARLKAYVGSALAGFAALSVLGVLTARDQLFSERQRKMIAFTGYANYQTPLPGYGRCFMEVEEDFHHFATECTQTSDPSRSVLVWGDSFARQLYPGLHEYFHATDIHILRLNASSCPPVLGIDLANRPHCHDINEFVIHEIERVKPKVVLLEAVWADVYWLPGFFDKLEETIAHLEGAGVQRIFVAGQLPMWTDRLPHLLEREFIDKGLPVPARTFLDLRKSILDVDGVLAQHLAVSHVRFLPLTRPVCDDQGCLVSVSDHLATDLLAYDDGHLTGPGSIYVTEEAIGPAIGAAFAH